MKKNIKFFAKSFFSFFALCFDIGYFYKYLNSDIEVFSGIGQRVFNGSFINCLFIFILLFLFYKKKEKKSNWIINILSGLFSFFMIFGKSYMYYGNMCLVFGSVLLFILSMIMAIGYYFLFRIILCYVFDFISNGKIKECKGKVIDLFNKHPFIFSLVLIIICWLPYIISFYPIILSPDPSFQIKQFFGIRTKYADYSILLDENVVITNHHPVVHTLLLGGCLKIGTLIGNHNLGLFIYSFIQIIILSTVFAYSIKYMLKNMKLNSVLCLIFALVYALIPMFPFYAMSGVKDGLFTAFVIWYVIFIHKFLSKNNDLKLIDYLLMILIGILVILFRNNGIYVIMLSFPFLILSLRKKWKPLLLVFIVLIGFNSCFNKVILPYYKITPGSIREMLSIPFQQTARYVKYHSEDLSKKDKKIIDKVLVYKTIGDRYEPELADAVKNKYNKYATSEDLKAYFGVWFKGLLKHPVTYINATAQNIYGYFYPEKVSWYVYHKYDTRITEDGFDYHYNEKLVNQRYLLRDFGVSFLELPVVGLISNIAFNTWCVFIMAGYCLYNKKMKRLVIYLPALISILICVASPANTYFRYALPFVFSMPFMIGCILEKRKEF